MSGAEAFLTSEAPVISLTAAQAQGAGVALDNKSCRANHTLVVLTSAGVSAGVVQLQGSLDGVSWFNMGAGVTTNAAGTVFPLSVGAAPARFVRANITTAITGGTVGAVVGSA